MEKETKSMTKIKVKPTIKMGCHEYRIVLSKTLKPDDGDDGFVHHGKQVIRIDYGLCSSRRMTTLFHEIDHIILKVFNLYLPEDRGAEAIIAGFAEGNGILFEQLGIELDWADIPIED